MTKYICLSWSLSYWFSTSLKSLKSITLYTQVHFCDTQSQKLLKITIFSWKNPKKMSDLLKGTQTSLSALVQCWTKSATALTAAWLSKKTCNQDWIREQGVWVSQSLWLIVSKTMKILKRFFEDPEKIFWKKISKRELYRHVY